MLSANHLANDPENSQTLAAAKGTLSTKPKLTSPARRTPTTTAATTSTLNSSTATTIRTCTSTTTLSTRRLPLADRSNQRSTPNRSFKSPPTSVGDLSWSDKRGAGITPRIPTTTAAATISSSSRLVASPSSMSNIASEGSHREHGRNDSTFIKGARTPQTTPSRSRQPINHSKTINDNNSWFEVPDPSGQSRIKELQAALRETLEENRQVHERCETLLKENEQLNRQVRELDVITMLYETAKREIEELTSTISKLQLATTFSTMSNDQ